MTLLNGAGAGFVTKIPHLVHLRGHALQQCSMAVFNPQFQRTRYQGRHGSNARAWSMNIQDALDLSLNEEAFRIIGKVYATRPLDQRVQILQHWASAVKPALAMRYLSEEDDCKYKQPLAACLKEAERTIDNYYKTRPGLNQEIDLPKEEPQRIEPTYAYPRMYDMDLRLEPRNPYDYRDSRNYR